MRQATYRSSTASVGLSCSLGQLAMRSQTFLTSSLILCLFFFIRQSRKAISMLISDRDSFLPLRSLNWRCFSCKLAINACLLLTKNAYYSDTSTIFSRREPSKIARQCLSPLSTRTIVWVGVFKCLTSYTQRKSSSKGTFPGGSTSLGVQMTSLRVGTSSSRIHLSACCQCSSILRLQQVSIYSRQNFSSLNCFWTQFSKTPNCGESRSEEKRDSFFSKTIGSGGRLIGFGDFLILCVRLSECLESDSSPELFYSPSRISKDIQNYYAGCTNCHYYKQSPNRTEETKQTAIKKMKNSIAPPPPLCDAL